MGSIGMSSLIRPMNASCIKDFAADSAPHRLNMRSALKAYRASQRQEQGVVDL